MNAADRWTTDLAADAAYLDALMLDDHRPVLHVTPGEEQRELPTSWTDAHVGEAFGATLVNRWLYCRALGGWLVWDGRRWALDEAEGVFEECRQWIVALGDAVWRSGDPKLVSQVARYRERHKIDAVVTIARRLDGIAADVDDFDRHPHLLNALNAVVDLRDGSVRSHDPALRFTKMAGADYRPQARHSEIDAVLNAVSDDVRGYLQRLLGSGLVGEVVDDKVPVLDGPGANGKTTLLKAVSLAAGDYAAAVPPRLLIARAAQDEHPTLIANLRGKRLAIIEETPEGGSLRMEQLKALSGGGELSARLIHGNYFTFTPTHQFVIATNHRPAVNASDYATWRRLELIPFPHTYRPVAHARPGDRTADPDLRRRTGQPAQRQAMLAWLVAGAIAWHSDGLGHSDEVRAATDAWRRDEDVIHAWWADTMNADPDASITAGDLYRTYTTWCATVGRPASSHKEFAKRFEEHDLFRDHDLSKRRAAAGQRYHGLAVQGVHGEGLFLARGLAKNMGTALHTLHKQGRCPPTRTTPGPNQPFPAVTPTLPH